jgi:hypothetical protein
MLTNSEEIKTRMDKIRTHLQPQHLQHHRLLLRHRQQHRPNQTHRLLQRHQRQYKLGQEEMLLWQPEIELDIVWIDYVHVYVRLHYIQYHKNTK